MPQDHSSLGVEPGSLLRRQGLTLPAHGCRRCTDPLPLMRSVAAPPSWPSTHLGVQRAAGGAPGSEELHGGPVAQPVNTRLRRWSRLTTNASPPTTTHLPTVTQHHTNAHNSLPLAGCQQALSANHAV